MKTIIADGISKSYRDVRAVSDLSFELEAGEILGLIGPNGAGKSSTIKMILDFLRPDSGSISLFGRSMHEGLKRRIGYLPEEKGLYRNDTAFEQIVYLASLKGMPAGAAGEKARELLARVGLEGFGDKKIKEMSKGMGQMVQLIVTVIHDPDLIILDEPFSGLDPVNTEVLRGIVGELRDRGKSIVLSTHQMNQVEEICDSILMIDKGRPVLSGSLSDVTGRFRRKSVLVEVEGDLPELHSVSRRTERGGGWELVPRDDAAPMVVLDELRDCGVMIRRFEVSTPSLHEIFLKVAGDE